MSPRRSMRERTVVDVRGGREVSLATAELAPGRLTRLGECAFSFSVVVPAARSYKFVVDDRHWVRCTLRQLRDAHGVVGMHV